MLFDGNSNIVRLASSHQISDEGVVLTVKKILVAGGAGYIGSHCCVELLRNGYEPVCADNFSSSSPEVPKRIEAILGKKLRFAEVDFRDYGQVERLCKAERFDAAIHLVGFKSIPESVAHPLSYYDNNIMTMVNVCRAMSEHCGKNVVFSSSAAVYGEQASMPVSEEHPCNPTNPYGRTKAIIEGILRDVCVSDKDWNVSILRYFNPVGAHPSGLIGENPVGIPGNLMPILNRVALRRQEKLLVYGGDYKTPDGTAVRDYIHVMDLARGHLAALEKLQHGPGCMVHNLGRGEGHSVMALRNAYCSVNGVDIPYEIVERRPGDVAECYADVARARHELEWEATLTVEDMVRDAYRWECARLP